MKKFFTLCMALLALSSMPAMAQDDDEEEIDNTLQFVDSLGNVIPDGSEITVNNLVDKGYQFEVSSNLFVNNTEDETIWTAMEVNINRIDNGVISCCFPLNCQQLSTSFTTQPGSVDPLQKGKSIQTEWLPVDGTSYGSAVVRLRICMYAQKLGIVPSAGEFTSYGPSVTVTFVNPDPTGISTATAATTVNKVTAIYNLRGEQLSQMQKGLNIVRYADGTTKKIIKQ